MVTFYINIANSHFGKLSKANASDAVAPGSNHSWVNFFFKLKFHFKEEFITSTSALTQKHPEGRTNNIEFHDIIHEVHFHIIPLLSGQKLANLGLSRF